MFRLGTTSNGMAYNTQNFKMELKKVEEWLSKEYSQVHTGRATPIVLDSIMVESYGSFMPIKNVAGITIEDPKTLRIAPWDKSQIKGIESAIAQANLGLSVVSDSDGVRVIFPMLTTENRTKLVKVLKEKLEDARINIRKERQNEMDKLDDLSEDEKKNNKEDIQKCVDDSNQNLESIFDKKETELMNQ
jgi:ribosome recycling factor